MKTLTHIITGIVLIFTATLAHAEKVVAGPKGGRLLETEGVKVEFLVEKDRTASVTFYDAALKAVAPTDQSVTAVAETPEGKKKIEFEKKGDALVSKAALPEGKGYTIVLQLKTSADAKMKNFRIPMNTEICGECKHPEYACTCESK